MAAPAGAASTAAADAADAGALAYDPAAVYDARVPGGGSMYVYRRVDIGGKPKLLCLGCGGFASTMDGIRLLGGEKVPVAIKQICLDAKAAAKAEAYEFRGLTALGSRNHPNIVKYLAFMKGEEGGNKVRLSFVFERCPLAQPFPLDAVPNGKGFLVPTEAVEQPPRVGCDLCSNALKAGKYSVREAVHVVRQLLSALAYLHSLLPPVLHRDVKPDNVLVWGVDKKDEATGEVLLRVKLTDYGTMRRADSRELTVGQGTAHFMAPEVAPESHDLSPRTQRPTTNYDSSVDVFSVGATLYFLVTGESPSPNVRKSWQARLGGETYVSSEQAKEYYRQLAKQRPEAFAAVKAAAEAEAARKSAASASKEAAAAAAGSAAHLTGAAADGAVASQASGLPRPKRASFTGDAGFAFELQAPPAHAAAPSAGSASSDAASGAAAPSQPGSTPASRAQSPARAGHAAAAVRSSVGSTPSSSASSAKVRLPAVTALDFYFPPGSEQRTLLEGLVHAAPVEEPAPAAAAGGASDGAAPPRRRRWTAAEALKWLDARWPPEVPAST